MNQPDSWGPGYVGIKSCTCCGLHTSLLAAPNEEGKEGFWLNFYGSEPLGQLIDALMKRYTQVEAAERWYAEQDSMVAMSMVEKILEGGRNGQDKE